MQHPFAVLEPEYEQLLSVMVVVREREVDEVARRLIDLIDAGRYKAGCDETEVPEALAASSFEREASSNFRLNPAQGAPLNERSRMIPHNGPFSTWTQAQVAAYRVDHLDAVGRANWTWARACYEEELFNGFGYRAHGVHSPYLFAGTNIYKIGKFDRDGHFVWEVDAQLGVIPVMKRIVQLRPDLDLAATPTIVKPADVPLVPAPTPTPEGLHDAAELQEALNRLPSSAFAAGFHAELPLAADGSFGRETRRAVEAFQAAHRLPVDGLAGALTWKAVEGALAA